jgi:hypothetical protein
LKDDPAYTRRKLESFLSKTNVLDLSSIEKLKEARLSKLQREYSMEESKPFILKEHEKKISKAIKKS